MVTATPPLRRMSPRHRRPAPSRRPAPRPLAGRDRGIELVRALCIVVIVSLHALQLGVTADASGAVLDYTPAGAGWYPPLTWFLQVMPLFFVIGGFAGLHARRRGGARGTTAAGFVAGRVHRLLVPALASILTAGLVLALLGAGDGIPPQTLADAAARYGQPLWFLGVFLTCQALLPAMLRVHERAPRRSLAALVAAAVLVDALRVASGVEAFGYLNLAAVWLALQQAGFHLAEGRIDALPRGVRAGAGIGALVLLAVACTAGVFSPDLIENLNPPTSALLLLGTAQVAGFSLLRPRITALAAHPRVAALTEFVSARAMTIYLWNLPVLLVMAGAGALITASTGLEMPAPSTAAWWIGRPLWIILALLGTAAVAAMIGGLERRPMPPATDSPARAAQAVLLAVLGVGLVLAVGSGPLAITLGAPLLVLALLRIRAAAPVASVGSDGPAGLDASDGSAGLDASDGATGLDVPDASGASSAAPVGLAR